MFALNSNIKIHSLNVKPIRPIDRILSGATKPGQIGPGRDGNEELLNIPQSSSIPETSPSDYLVSYPWLALGESYPFVEMLSVYSSAPDDWAIVRWKVSGHTTSVLWVAASRICSKQLVAFLNSFHQAFSQGILLEFKWCNLTVVVTELQLGRILILFHQRNQLSIFSMTCQMCYKRMLFLKYVFNQPFYHRQKVTQGQFLSGLQLVLNLEFSFFKTGCLKESSVHCYFPTTRQRIDEVIPFSRALVQIEMQTVLSRI